MRMYAAVAATGIVSIIMMEILAALFMPMMGILVGFLVIAFKLALFLLAAFLIVRWCRNREECCG